MLPNHQYPIPQREPLIRIIRGPRTSGSKGKGQFCCQQYACAHQDNAEWVVGWHFEHRWLLLQKEPQARVRARLGPRARAWVRNTYARPPGRQSIRKPVTPLRLDINVTAGGISSSAVSRCERRWKSGITSPSGFRQSPAVTPSQQVGSLAMLAAMREVSLYVSSTLLAAFRGAHLYHLSIIDRANSSARSRGPVTTFLAPSMPAG